MRLRRYQYTRAVALLALFFALYIALPAGAWDLPSHSAFTVRTEIEVPHDVERTGEEINLVGLATAEGELLSVRWTRVDGGWFPYWVLRLIRGAGSAAVSETELATVTPVPKATYRTALSWDPALDSLAIQVTDADGRIVYSNVTNDPTLPDTPMPVERVTTSGTVTGIHEGYVPFGLRWTPGIRHEEGFRATLRFERDDDAVIRIEIPGVAPGDGEFRLHTADGLELGRARPMSPVTEFAFPVSQLSIGRSELTLSYTLGEQTLAAWEHSVTVGNVAIRYDEVVRDPEAGVVQSVVWLESASDLPDLEIKVRAQLFEMRWNETTRRYEEVLFADIDLISQSLDIAEGTVGVPLQFAAPDEPGVWKVLFETVLAPDVLQFHSNIPYYFSTYAPATIEPGDGYTFVVLPDTQFYAQSHPHIFMRQAEWIAANAQDRKIGLVLHMGDITNANTWEQWRVAANSMKLLNHVVPYVLSIGNHDNFPEGRGNGQTTRRGDSKINAFFFPHEFPHLGGTFEPERLENAYYSLDIGGKEYLIISLEFAPSDEMVAWADEVTSDHPDHTTILVTHTYTNHYGRRTPVGQIASGYDIGRNPDTTVNDGEAIWEKYVRKHPNIQFVFSGHIHSSVIPYSSAVGDHGNTVYEVLMDYQSEEMGGNGYLVLWEFHPDGTVDITAYSPYLGQVKTDVQAGFRNAFTLALDAPLVPAVQ